MEDETDHPLRRQTDRDSLTAAREVLHSLCTVLENDHNISRADLLSAIAYAVKKQRQAEKVRAAIIGSFITGGIGGVLWALWEITRMLWSQRP